MSNLKSIFILIMSIVLMSTIYSTVASASEVSLSESSNDKSIIEHRLCKDFYIVDGNADFAKNEKNYILTGKTVITKDTNAGNKHIYLKRGSALIIKNGASFSTNGTLTIERGAKLYVTDGKLVCGKNSVLENYGRIIIREKGTLTVEQRYWSNGGSSISLQGKMYLGKQSVSAIVKKIKKYDEKFNLDDYCISFSKRAKLDPTFYYCINDVITDYYYKCSDNKITRKGYSLSKVYSNKTNCKIKDSAKKYLSDNGITEKFSDDMIYFSVDYRFDYSYSRKELTYCETYFKYTPEGDGTFIMAENENTERVF